MIGLKPNILWICADQLRYDTLSVSGDPIVSTPNIERLSAMGVQFSNCYCQNPVCAPSRASFLTGRYPRTARVRQNGQDIPPDEVTVPKMLTDNGYVCGLAGKLHISACHPSVCPVTERRIDDGYGVFKWSHGTMYEYDKNVWMVNEYTDWLLAKGITHNDTIRDDCRFLHRGIASEHSQTHWCTDMALDFIGKATTVEKPWLFSINYYDPHHQFDPPEDLLQKYVKKLDEIPLPKYTPGELDNKPIFQRKDHTGAYDNPGHYAYTEMTDYDHKMIRAAYYAMIELLDTNIGRLLDDLEARGILDNTMVIFHSDHGEMLGDHGIYLKGPYFYEPGVRVPLIISLPGKFQAGQVCNDLTELTDLAPTILEACGFEPGAGMQGRSLLPILAHGAAGTRDSVYCEYYDANIRHQNPKAHLTMVRNARYKLVRSHGAVCGVGGELYDLHTDPGEVNNLYGNVQHAAIQIELLEKLADRMAQTADPLPLRRASW